MPPSYVQAGRKALRYRNPIEKGIYWYWFAKYVVARDYVKWGGLCISCGKPKQLKELQAGHFMPAGSCGFALLFDPKNVNAECGGCNAFDQTHLLGYAENLDKRYGTGTALTLRARHAEAKTVQTKEWGVADYEREIPIVIAKYNGYIQVP